MLGVATIAEFMFTPRGLSRLAHVSLRTLRRQTNVVSDVGEELVEEGWRAIKQPLKALTGREGEGENPPSDPAQRR